MTGCRIRWCFFATENEGMVGCGRFGRFRNEAIESLEEIQT